MRALLRNRVTQAPDGKTRVTLTGNVHPLARAENSRGAVEDSLAMPRILLQLKRSDQQQAALQSLMEAQQDKSSPNYHAWLTPDQFGKQFGASDTDLQAVTDWLTAQGFQNVQVAAGRRATSDKSVTTSRLLIRKPATTIGTVGCSLMNQSNQTWEIVFE
jgi:Pro-kumamolisin, activation domain